MDNIFYLIVVKPIELIIELVFSILNSNLSNVGISIIFTSIIINTLWLPFYLRANKIQVLNKQKQESLDKWSKHIKKYFKGDEQYMILDAYYRENNYKVWYQIKSLIPLLLELPFMIAGYHFFSNLMIEDKSFWFISDLTKADGLISINGIVINILPLLMTLINIISSFIYANTKNRKEIIQSVIIALFFLVILYPCPSALLIYWICNNLYSLIKNCYLCIFKAKKENKLATNKKVSKKSLWGDDSLYSKSYKTYYLSIIFITLFVGIYIPYSLISTSPTEFDSYTRNHIELFFNNFFTILGTFALWGNIIYHYSSNKGKRIMTMIMWIYAILSIIDYYLWSNVYPNVSPLFVYDKNPMIDITDFMVILGTEIVFATIIIAVIIFVKKPNFSIVTSNILVIFVFFMTIYQIIFSSLNVAVGDYNKYALDDNSKVFTLSKNGKNVVFIMLDRGIGGYIPFIFEEKPELKEKFSGFTYYRNTLSFGAYTKFSVPSMFGGYEYTPQEISKRDDVLMKNKHDEALMVLPVLFSNNNYNVTVTDLPYAGYAYNCDMSCLDSYPNINKYVTIGAFNRDIIDDDVYENIQQRRFYFYSLSRSLPTVLQSMLYEEGNYYGANNLNIILSSFVNSYNALDNMIDITVIKDDDSNNYISFQNETTHEPVVLDYHTYDPYNDNNFEFNNSINDYYNSIFGKDIDLSGEAQYSHYCVNMASYIKIGEWLDFLKKQGVYDNTRIIIASDHGRGLNQFDELYNDSYSIDAEYFNPIFLVKDFDSNEFTTNDNLMTLAEIPNIATKDLINNPVNPFTGYEFTNLDTVFEDGVLVYYSGDWVPDVNAYTFDLQSGKWFKVKENMWIEDNWSLCDENGASR